MATARMKKEQPKLTTEEIKMLSGKLQALQKQRAWHMKTRNMVANRLRATVAGALGYNVKMAEKDRTKLFSDATALIKRIEEGEQTTVIHRGLVLTTCQSINAFLIMQEETEKEMLQITRMLPVASWVQLPEQRGFGLPGLGILIGETGDLANYEAPGKMWRRMACAPYTKDGLTAMGATWRSRSNGKDPRLGAADWEEFGYSPRRRSISYLIGEGLIKQNFLPSDMSTVTEQRIAGPYRQRYIDAKVRATKTHPEWTWSDCDKCKDLPDKSDCGTCGGTGMKCKRAHLHGMLLATKLLFKNLWMEWNPDKRTNGWEG